MEWSYPQALLSTPGMVSVLILVIVAEVLSLAFLGIASYEFRQMLRRHATFFSAMSNDEKYKREEHSSLVIYWIYIISTLIITVVTFAIFIFQPHIL